MLSRRHVKIVLFAAALALLAGCKVQLYADLDERDANAILGALLENEVRAEKRPGEEGMYIIMVEEEDFPRAQRITERLNLPHPPIRLPGYRIRQNRHGFQSAGRQGADELRHHPATVRNALSL